MRAHEQINAVVSLTLVGLALYFVLEFPAQEVAITLFGTPLGINSPRRWLMALLLVMLVMTGADMVARSHPALPSRRLSYLATFWTLPGLIIIAASQILWLAPSPLAWGGGLVLVGLLLWLTMMAGFQQIHPRDTSLDRWTYLWEQFIGYALALILFMLIYQPRMRGALSMTEVLLVSGMIALALLRQKPDLISKTWLYAAIIGLSLGQLTWALNYWRVDTLSAGLFLLLIFYILVGLAQQHLLAKLSRQSIWEFGLVTSVTLIVIFIL